MSKKIYLFSLVLLALAFTACSETEETGKYDNWRARNEAFIDSIANVHANIATRGQLDSIHMIAYPGVPIYFKKKTPVGDGVIQDIVPRATDEVTVYYKGSYIIWGNTGGYVDKQDARAHLGTQTATQRQRLRFGKEEQGSGRMTSFLP